jgi:hypothetical protein
MRYRLLILEPDKEFAARLVKLLDGLQPAQVSVVANIKEACLRLVLEKQDLALIPLLDLEQSLQALRDVQPDLRLVIVAPTAGAAIPETFSGKVQGVLLKSHLEADLATVLKNALDQPLLIAKSVSDRIASKGPPLDIAILIAALQRAKLGRLVHSAVLARGTILLAHWGELHQTQAAAVASHAGEAWQSLPGTARIRFLHLPARAGDMLLYTRRIHEDHLLTLVALPETPISELRAQSEPVLSGLHDVITGKASHLVVTGDPSRYDTTGNRSYAIVWRPVEALPTSLHIPLRRAIARLATTNACVLRHNVVQSELVQLVVTCPPGRDSAWAAYLFKNGSEETIQQEFNVEANLWDTGYYAVESSDPLSESELNLFMEHSGSDERS